MEQVGIVQSASDGYAAVKVIRAGACGKGCTGCGVCGEKYIVSRVNNVVGAKAGDKVMIEISTGKIILAAFLMYIMPLFAATITGAAVIILTRNNLCALLSGAAVFAANYLFIYISDKNSTQKNKYMSSITKVLN